MIIAFAREGMETEKVACCPRPGPYLSTFLQGDGNRGRRPASFSIIVIDPEEGPHPAIPTAMELPAHSQARKG